MGVSPWFVELKIRSGELPALRLCRHYTILKEDMDNFLDTRRNDFFRRTEAASGKCPQNEKVKHGNSSND